MITRRSAIARTCAALVPALLHVSPTRAAGTPSPAGHAGERPIGTVIATFSILADFVRNVGGERVEVSALVGPNGNAHVYAPSPADAKKLAQAKAVFVNGLGFEGWLDRLVKASATAAPVIVASKGIKPIEAVVGERDAVSGDEHGRTDPHAWQSVPNAKTYVANIRDALVALDPAGTAAYERDAGAYVARLDALDRELRDVIARIPPERRRVLTSHRAFAYFDAAYGIRFIAPQGVSTESDASAKDVAGIITQIRRDKVAAVFLENVSDPRLIQQIAGETGAKVGGILYSDALTDPSGDAPSYIALIHHNLKQLAAALMS